MPTASMCLGSSAYDLDQHGEVDVSGAGEVLLSRRRCVALQARVAELFAYFLLLLLGLHTAFRRWLLPGQGRRNIVHGHVHLPRSWSFWNKYALFGLAFSV